MSRIEKRFRRIAQKLTHFEIQAGISADFDLKLDDLFTGNRPIQAGDLFLGKYSRDGINLIIQRFGFDKLLRRRGLGQLDIVVDTSDPYRHILRIFHNQKHTDDHLICEFVTHQDLLQIKDSPETGYNFNLTRVVNIEWMTLQNPSASFTSTRPPLPGQHYPGLGLGDEVLALLILMGRHLRVDALLNVPQYYHTALMFNRRFHFLNPEMQATVQTITRDLWRRYRLSAIAWAIYYQCIVDESTSGYFVWKPEEQMVPIASRIRKYFTSAEYEQRVQATMKNMKFRLDENKLRDRLDHSGPSQVTI